MKKRTNHSDSGLLFAGKLFLIVGASIYVILLICQERTSTINFDSCEHAGGLFLVFGEWTIRKAMKARLSFPILAFVTMMTLVLGARWFGSLLALATLAWGLAKSDMNGIKPGNSGMQGNSRLRWVSNLWS